MKTEPLPKIIPPYKGETTFTRTLSTPQLSEMVDIMYFLSVGLNVLGVGLFGGWLWYHIPEAISTLGAAGYALIVSAYLRFHADRNAKLYVQRVEMEQ